VMVDVLRELTAKHGVTVLQNAGESLSSDELLRFAERFGEPILLPNGFGFNHTDSAPASESYVVNITNIDPLTGEAKAASAAGEYLHNDGDFWTNHYIFSFLYGVAIPDKGGNTQFLDLQRAHDLLRDEHRDLFDVIDGESVVIDVNEIPDFRGSPFLEKFNAEHETAKHLMVDRHRVTNRPVLYYGCKHAEIDGFGVERSSETLQDIDDILATAAKTEGPLSYSHRWSENDLVLWDNTRVMHRAAGGHGASPRVLWRVESHIAF